MVRVLFKQHLHKTYAHIFRKLNVFILCELLIYF